MGGYLRGVSLTLATLAIALKLLAPPGFMPENRAGQFQLVICTGHGPLVLSDRGAPNAPSHKAADPPCAFAGATTPPAPSSAPSIAAPGVVRVEQAADAPAHDLAPGRGLAAPPPQAHAPPDISI